MLRVSVDPQHQLPAAQLPLLRAGAIVAAHTALETAEAIPVGGECHPADEAARRRLPLRLAVAVEQHQPVPVGDQRAAAVGRESDVVDVALGCIGPLGVAPQVVAVQPVERHQHDAAAVSRYAHHAVALMLDRRQLLPLAVGEKGADGDGGDHLAAGIAREVNDRCAHFLLRERLEAAEH